MSLTVFIMAPSVPDSSPGLRPFASLELLGKPMFRYVQQAAEKAGFSPEYLFCKTEKEAWETLSVLPEGMQCLSSQDAASMKSQLQELEAVLLLWADAFSITPELIAGLVNGEPGCCLVADGTLAAAYCTGAEAADLLMEDSISLSVGWLCYAPHELDRNCRWISTGANTRRDFHQAAQTLRMQVLEQWMEKGVLIPCTDGVMISTDTKIGEDTLILPGTLLMGHCTIGRNCVIGPNTVLTDSTIGDESHIDSSKVTQSKVGTGVKIGPYSQLRPNCHIADGVKIGDFVEVKNSIIGQRTSVAHLTYVGDSDVGSRVNFGCGTVTSNYDGQKKYRTVIGDNAFIGCNTNLVAPVTVGDGAYTAAGSTITKDVPSGALAIARSRQEIKPGWAQGKLGKK